MLDNSLVGFATKDKTIRTILRQKLSVGLDDKVNKTLALLRKERKAGSFSQDTQIIPGVKILSDPDDTNDAHYKSPVGRLLEISNQTIRSGKYFAVHIELSPKDISNLSLFGFICKSTAAVQSTMRVCLRSHLQDRVIDSFFDKQVVCIPDESIHMDVIDVTRRNNVPATAKWRELVLLLPNDSFEIAINDLRIFAI